MAVLKSPRKKWILPRSLYDTPCPVLPSDSFANFSKLSRLPVAVLKSPRVRWALPRLPLTFSSSDLCSKLAMLPTVHLVLLHAFWETDYTLVNSLSFYIPEAWKMYPFWAEPPRIGHLYRECLRECIVNSNKLSKKAGRGRNNILSNPIILTKTREEALS